MADNEPTTTEPSLCEGLFLPLPQSFLQQQILGSKQGQKALQMFLVRQMRC